MSNDRFQAKNFFRLNGGLNTEINELNFQDGFTKDEANYELLVDGSRRRRKGLAAEASAGTAKTVTTLNAGEISQTYLWENVGGDPDKSLMVYRKGATLYFADADEIISDSWYSGAGGFIPLSGLVTDDGSAALIRATPVTFSQGKGHLYVANKWVYPMYISYDSATDQFAANKIPVLIRDYTTVEDNTAATYEPLSASPITAIHRYNLRNRGWSEADISSYGTDVSSTTWPGRNKFWYKGYERYKDESVAASIPGEGTYGNFDYAKMSAEIFGQSEAPTGNLFLDVADTTEPLATATGDAASNIITAFSHADVGGGEWEVTLTLTSNHALGLGATFTIANLDFDYYMDEGGDLVPFYGYDLWNGEQTTSANDSGTQTLKFKTTSIPVLFDSYIDKRYGTVDTTSSTSGLTRASGTDHGEHVKAIEFHDGRVFYAGMENAEFADYIFFSQVLAADSQVGKCFQTADPTDPDLNSLVPSDGGYMVIPGLSGVQNMVSVRNVLLVFTNRGVWEINGGRAGIFTADGYGVRKLTDNACNSATTPIAIEDSCMYTGPGGIYVISPNQYTGVLEAQSVSDTTIQTYWNQIPAAEQVRMQTAYDSALKRLYFMYGPDGTSIGIDTMIIFDVRATAWFRYTFDTPANNVLLTGFSIENADDTSANKKMKFIYEVTTTTVQVADFAQTSFDDWDGTNGPLPYLTFGDDNIGDWQSRRQAPVVTVYSKRTETKWTDTGAGLNADFPSSTLMTPFWDWTDEVQWTTAARVDQEAWDGTTSTTNPSVSGKIGKQQEVYRAVRQYIPYGDALSEVSGYPVVVTRNKIRGRGRALRLRFDGATDKDSHILGYTMNYKVARRQNV